MKLFHKIMLETRIQVIGFISFLNDLLIITKQISSTKSEFKITKLYPIYTDRFNKSGETNTQYFHQDLYVAREIFIRNPSKHVDIGSRIDGFVAHVASYREIEVIDIRPNKGKIRNITFHQMNIMEDTPTLHEYCDSISSLHSVEHFGLGRYGDPIDINGHIKGLDNINKILKKGGIFYLSVPFGSQRIEFNAHRIFSLEYLIKLFNVKYKITSFSYINDSGEFFPNTELTSKKISQNYNCNNGCVIFQLIKL